MPIHWDTCFLLTTVTSLLYLLYLYPSQRPSFVLLFPNRKIRIINPLCLPFDSNHDFARTRKSNRRASLMGDLRLSSEYTRFFSFQLGDQGFIIIIINIIRR